MRPSVRNELVEMALSIFYRNGFHATGMDKLVAETGVSKTTMYKHFRTKDDLIVATLQLRDDNFRSWLFRRMAELANEPRAQLLAMFDALAEWFAQPDYQGCMFIKAASEFQDPAHPIYQQAASHKRLLEVHLTGLAQQAGARDPGALARQLLVLKEGAIVSAQLGHTKTAATDAKTAAAVLIAKAIDEPA